MTPEQYVQDKAAASGSSFYYAFLFLEPPRRAAITAFYAFCREVDDVADEVSDPGVARDQARVVAQRGGVDVRRPPVASGNAGAAAACRGVRDRAAPALAVIDGCQMDLEQSRYLDFAEPGSATATSSPASSARSQPTSSGARSRRRSTTRTASGWRCSSPTSSATSATTPVRGRIYLPMSELKQFDVKAAELLERRYSDRFTALMRFQAERAHGIYDEALALLGDADRPRRSPG